MNCDCFWGWASLFPTVLVLLVSMVQEGGVGVGVGVGVEYTVGVTVTFQCYS